MPRVHGFDIVPRRGRGRGRPRPSVASGGSASHIRVGAVAAVVGDDVSANFEETKEDYSSPANNTPENIYGNTLRLPLEIRATGKGSSAPTPTSPFPDSQETVLTSNKAAGSKVFALGTPKAPMLSATKSVESSRTNSSIRPRARESLNHLDFGSHSFSVQEISHKSPPKFILNNNDSAYCSVGLAPSLKPMSETTPSVSETARLVMDKDIAKMPLFVMKTKPANTAEGEILGSQQPPEESKPASQAVELMANKIEGNRMETSVEANATLIANLVKSPMVQPQQSSGQPSPESANDKNHSNQNSNAHWLYRHCSKACVQMEARLTALELAIKTLQAIQSISDDDDLEEKLQQKLFSFKDGKRRDLDFVFGVVEKAYELREDQLLNEEKLREIASFGDVVMFDLDNQPNNECPLGERREIIGTSSTGRTITKGLNQLPGVSTPQIARQGQQHTITHSMTDGDTPRKMIRSRRKKRPSHKNITENARTREPTSVSEKGPTTGDGATNKETHIDFPVERDRLDMRDDEKWSFLPSALLQPTAESEYGEILSRRVTRSMGLADDNNIDSKSNAVENSQKTETSKLDENALRDNAKQGKATKNTVVERTEVAEADDDVVNNIINDASKAEKLLKMSSKTDTGVNEAKCNEKWNEDAVKIGAIEESTRLSEEKPTVETVAQSYESVKERIEMNSKSNLPEADNNRGSNSIDDNSKMEIAIKMNGETDEVEHLAHCSENQDKALDDMVGLIEEPIRLSEEKLMVETVARSSEETTEPYNKFGWTEDASHPSHNETISRIVAQGNDVRDMAIKIGDMMEGKENPNPGSSEETHIDENEVYAGVKTRQRGECKDNVRIMLTGITATHRHMQMIETIGAEFIDSIKEAHTATHVIAKDDKTKLRRTPKLLICICKVSKILSMEWLEQSAKEQRILDTDDFLLLDDREAEERYGFSMKETIRNGILARRKRGGVLGGWCIYICSGVAGNKAPNMKEFQFIIDAAGGRVVRSLSNSNSFDPLKTIVLTSEPSTKSQLKERGVSKVHSQGAKILSTAWLFHTIITQNLFDIDVKEDAVEDARMNSVQVSDLVRCNSEQSLTSTISVMSASPPVHKNGGPLRGGNVLVQTNGEDSVRSSSNRGSGMLSTSICATFSTMGFSTDRGVDSSMTSTLPLPPSTLSELQRRKLNFDDSKLTSSQICATFITRDQFHSSRLSFLSSIESLLVAKDEAASQTHGLWLDYFNKFSCTTRLTDAKHSRSNKDAKPESRPRRGVRCLRGRRRCISPLVSSSTPISATAAASANKSNQPKSLSPTSRKISVEENPYVTWEAYVLFTLIYRTEKLGSHESLTSDAIKPASRFFPRPLSINSDGGMKLRNGNTMLHQGKKLSLEVGARKLVHSDRSIEEAFEIFGSLSLVFSLYQQHQTSGMIPEAVIALLALQAIEAVSAMHACGVVHNDIGMDSFLVVRRVALASGKKEGRKKKEDNNSSWYLQIVGFGYKSVVLNCQQKCQDAHYEHDYHCLGNIIHQLLTGGVEIALNATAGGLVEFTSKAFIRGNLFLRGALSWCSLIDALMCVGELAPTRNRGSIFFRLQHPVDVLNLAAPEGRGNNRMHQFGWSCRVLQELSGNSNLAAFLDGLCSHNSRYKFPGNNLSIFACSALDGRQSFACYTSSEETVEHLMQKESKLEEDILELMHRENELQDEVDQFEQSKKDYQSVLSKLQMRENKLLQRERAHRLEVQQLERMKERLREINMQQKLHSLKKSAPNRSASPTRPTLRKMIKADHSPRSHGNIRVDAHASIENQSGRKRMNSGHSKPQPNSRNSKLLSGERTPPKRKISQCREDGDYSTSNRGPQYWQLVAQMCENFDGDSTVSPKHARRNKQEGLVNSPPMWHRQNKDRNLKSPPSGPKQKKGRDAKSPPIGHFRSDCLSHLEDLHGGSQESHDSVSGIKKTKRKSPKCSLLSLAPPKKALESPQKPPRPQKVLITFGDD